MGIQEPISAEILAILKACELCASNLSLADKKIQIASDSSIAVSWANCSDDFGNLNSINAVYDIRSFLSSLKGLSIVYNSRDSNVLADGLAKTGSHGGVDSIVWGDL